MSTEIVDGEAFEIDGQIVTHVVVTLGSRSARATIPMYCAIAASRSSKNRMRSSRSRFDTWSFHLRGEKRNSLRLRAALSVDNLDR